MDPKLSSGRWLVLLRPGRPGQRLHKGFTREPTGVHSDPPAAPWMELSGARFRAATGMSRAILELMSWQETQAEPPSPTQGRVRELEMPLLCPEQSCEKVPFHSVWASFPFCPMCCLVSPQPLGPPPSTAGE